MSKRTEETNDGFFSDIIATSIYVILSTCMHVIKSACLLIRDIFIFTKKKSKANKVIGDSLKKSCLKPSENLSEKKIIRKLSLGTIKNYSSQFEDKEIQQGMAYYAKRKVGDIVLNSGTYTASVKSNKNYTVHIKLNDKEDITEATCNCKIESNVNKYCKHVYAVLLKIKCDGNVEKLWQAIANHMECASDLISNIVENIDYVELSQNNRASLIERCKQADELLEMYNKNLSTVPDEYVLIEMLQQISKTIYELRKELNNCIMTSDVKESTNNFETEHIPSLKLRKPKKRLVASIVTETDNI